MPTRTLAWIAAVLWTAFAALTALLALGVAAPLFDTFDRAVTAAALDSHTDALTAVALWCHQIGGWPWGSVLVIGLVLPLVLTRRWDSAVLVLAAWAATALVAVPLVKDLLDRARPLEQLVTEVSPAYPSGHTALAAALAMAAVAVCPARVRGWVLVGGLAFTALMAWSRVYLGVHWLSDTVAGALLGYGICLVVWWVVESVRGRGAQPVT